jgi:Bacterial toxin 44
MSPPRLLLPTGPASRPLSMLRQSSFTCPLVLDEVSPLAQYMAQEMSNNPLTEAAKRIKALNSFSAEACIADYKALPIWQQILGLGITPNDCVQNQITFHAAAMLAWAELVQPNGVWDHKPKIAPRFNPRMAPAPQYWHAFGQTEYLYDVWSNMHYGYVGMAIGFDEAVLLDGAGLAQLLSDLVKQKKLPAGYGGHKGLRRFDPLSDRSAIRMGVMLYKSHPRSVNSNDLLRVVIGSTAITSRPLQP